MERCINPLIIVIISIQLLSVAGEEVSTLLRQRRKTQGTKGSRYRVTFALCPLPPVPQKVPLSPHRPESAPTKAWLEPKCQASLQMPHISLRNANSSLDHSNKEGFIKKHACKNQGRVLLEYPCFKILCWNCLHRLHYKQCCSSTCL